MKRREFIALLGGVAAAWPIPVRAQQKTPIIGYLVTGSPAAFASRLAAFRQGLAEQGFVEGQNVAIEYRWAGGIYDQLQAFAADLVGRKVDVIFAAGPPSLHAAKDATSIIPVVFVVGSDPVRDGLVANMSRPDRNLTGISFLAVDLTPKRLELITELVPGSKVIGLLTNHKNAAEQRVIIEMHDATRRAGFQVAVLNASNEAEIDAAFVAMVRSRPDVLIVSPDTLFTTRTDQIVASASRHSIPAIYAFREAVVAGGLASYGPSAARVHREAGSYVGRILKGDKPGDLPVLQPTTFEMVINSKTAKSLGLNVPPTLLARADEVIE